MTNLFISLFLFLGMATYSQEVEITESSVIGIWEVTDIVKPELTKDEIDEMKSLLEGTYLDFRPDKTCIVGIVMDLDGTWSLDAVKKKITTITKKGETVWVIHSLTQDQIVMSRNDAKQKVVFKKL